MILVPSTMLPVAAALGTAFTVLEGWTFWDGVLRVAGNIVLIPLTSKAPETDEGKVVDFLVSFLGLGLFCFVVALVGALPFVDTCAEKLGGKLEGVGASIKFAVFFFLLVLPVTCATLS